MSTTKACLFGGALMSAGLSVTTAAASDVHIEGTLYQEYSDFDYTGPNQLFSYGPTSIDYYDFTVNTSGSVQFDILSFDAFSSFIDSVLVIYANDGTPLSIDNYVDSSDDHFGADLNGSSYFYDSFLDVFLDAGDYTVVVASYGTTYGDIESRGFSMDAVVLTSDLGGPIPTEGRYALDVYGDVSFGMAVVPLPPAGWAGLGLLGAMGVRRRLRR